MLTTSVPVALFLLFAAGHASNWRETGHLTGLMLVVQELVLVALFVVRRRPLESSHQALHWFVAMAGSFAVLLLRPAAPVGGLVGHVALLLQVAGACGAIVCLASLGRSFGIVAANRGPKVGGPYRLVRHPIYAAYLIGWAGYLLAAPTARNAIVLAVAVFFQLRRITTEESVLRSRRDLPGVRLTSGVPLDPRRLLSLPNDG